MSAKPQVPADWRAYVGTTGVFLGAGIVSLGQRVLSTGLPDLRGALGLGFDAAAWIPTASNMGQMFMGVFTVYLGALFGPRRVLLVGGVVFTLVSAALPLARSYSLLIVLQLIGGIASGTFYPLSINFAITHLPPRLAIYAIGAYSLELIGTLSLGTPLEGWFIQRASWHWLFWHSAVLVPLMMLCIVAAIPPEPKAAKPRLVLPKVSWQGLLFASLGLSLIVGALEQGDRLNWLKSGVVVTLFVSGLLLLSAAWIRRRVAPNPWMDLAFLWRRNTILLGGALFSLRFVLLAVVLLIPAYLGLLAHYRPEQTGRVLLWMTIPQVIMGQVAVQVMRRFDGRLVAAIGFSLAAISCLMNARLTSDWANMNFWWPQIVMASALAFLFVGIIGLIPQQAVMAGAMSKPVDALTYVSYYQVIRLLGGDVGVAILQRVLTVREKFHSSMLNEGLQAGHALTDERLRGLAAGLLAGSSGSEESQGRAVAALAGEVAQQAYTLTYADGFILVARFCAATLVVVACMKDLKVPVPVARVAASPAE